MSADSLIPGADPGACPDCGDWRKAGLLHECRHVDFVGHDWMNLREYLIERRRADEPNAGKSGDYAHYSEPHTSSDCPFSPPLHEGKT